MKLLLLLTAFATLPLRAAAPASDFIRQVEENVPAWDSDSDQSLALTELDRAIADSQCQGSAAAAAVALRRGLQAAKRDRIAVAELQQNAPGQPDFQPLFAWAGKRLQAANRELFATSPPRIEALQQGKLGDCFCLAALRSVLHRDPLEITRMIQPRADGGYRTRLGTAEVDTPPLTDGEIILGASTANGLWPLVYEKAVGLSRLKPEAKDATPFNNVTKGGSAGSMMSMLTARDIRRWSCKTWRDTAPDPTRQTELVADLREQLQSAFAEKRLVTGGTGTLAKGATRIPGMNYGHGYAVLGYDADADAITLWNPHADDFTPKGPAGPEHGYAMQRGQQTIPLTELITFFGGFAFEQHP